MPGLFGLISRDNSRQFIADAIARMGQLLQHKTDYKIKTCILENAGFGLANIRLPALIHTVHCDNHCYKVCIDGYIYTLLGKAIEVDHMTDEVIAHGIIAPLVQERFDNLAEIKGNFILSVYDETDRVLFLASDIIGPRKLYYAQQSAGLLYSPEVKAIAMQPQFDKTIDPQGLSDFFNYGYILGEKTFFKGIRCLPAATVLRYNAKENEVRMVKYWQPRYTSVYTNLDEAADLGNALVFQSINEKALNGQRIICPISGGLDSRIIISNLTRVEKNIQIKPITHGQRFSHEYKNAKKVCRKLNLKGHDLVEINAKALLDKLELAVWLSEGMVGMHNAHTLLHFEHLGREYASFFNGIYGGPTNYDALYYAERHLRKEFSFTEKAEDIYRVISVQNELYNHVIDPGLFAAVQENAVNSIASELEQCLDYSAQFCNQRDAFFIKNRMRRFICQGSLSRFFWEEQLPLSNYDLYAFYLGTKPELKLNRMLLKTMIIKRFPELKMIPDSNTGLPLGARPSQFFTARKDFERRWRYYVSRFTRGRVNLYDKTSYSHYLIWLREDRNTIAFYRKWLNQAYACRQGLIDCAKANELMDSILKGASGFEQLLRIVTFCIWYEFFIEKNGIEAIQCRIKNLERWSRE